MEGLIRRTTYAKNEKGGWIKTDEAIERATIDFNHWQSWAIFDRKIDATARLFINGGYMLSYTTTNPDKTKRVKYERLTVGYNCRSFDRFDFAMSDKLFNLLKRRARKCAEAAGVNFELESCFINSGDLHGFYFPNNTNGARCVAFVRCVPVLLSDKQINEVL